MSSFQPKSHKACQKTKPIWSIQRKKLVNRKCPWERPYGGFTRQRLQNSCLKTAQRTKRRHAQSQENDLWTKWNYQRIENIKKEPKRNPGAENCNNQSEKFTRVIQKQIWQKEERINEVEGRTIEIIESEEQKEKDQRKWTEPMGPEGYHQDDQYLHCGRSRGGERGEGAARLLEEVMTKTFPNVMKDMSTNTQEAQQTPGKINAKRPTCIL